MLPNKTLQYKINPKNTKTMHANPNIINLLNNNKVIKCLTKLHDDYVIV